MNQLELNDVHEELIINQEYPIILQEYLQYEQYQFQMLSFDLEELVHSIYQLNYQFIKLMNHLKNEVQSSSLPSILSLKKLILIYFFLHQWKLINCPFSLH